MAKGKWGESFLKSGLPLEHLTLVTLKGQGWRCSPGREVSRPNRDAEHKWFEIDLEAECKTNNRDTQLALLVECKYHDLSRSWFFLPHERDRWHFDDRVLNCGPIQTLAEPRKDKLLQLAPRSTGGIVVSEDGQKQDNAVYAATQQLANAFVPHALRKHYRYFLGWDPSLVSDTEALPDVGALIPVIVTNASLFRLKPSISELERIREADKPNEIADEVDWTWLYFDPSGELRDQNYTAIRTHAEQEARAIYRFPFVEARMHELAARPNWIGVVNIKALGKATKAIVDAFLSLPMIEVQQILKPAGRKTGKGDE